MDKSSYCIYINIFFSLFFWNSLSGKNTGIKYCFCFLFTDVFLVYMWYNVYFLTSIKVGKERLWHTSMRTGSMEEELVILVCFRKRVHIFCASLSSLFHPILLSFWIFSIQLISGLSFPCEWKLVVFYHLFCSWTHLPALLDWTLVQSSQISEFLMFPWPP